MISAGSTGLRGNQHVGGNVSSVALLPLGRGRQRRRTNIDAWW
jgi:hypothetical protein